MKLIGVAFFLAVMVLTLPSGVLAAEGEAASTKDGEEQKGKKDADEPMPVPTEDAVLEPPPTEEDVVPASMQVTIQQLYFPAKPGSTKPGTCRMTIRAMNIGDRAAGTSLFIRTYNYRHEDLDVWQVPTGSVAPGQVSERTYACKRAHFIRIENSPRGWPTRCVIDDVAQIPCGMSLTIDSNLTLENQTLKRQ